MLTFIAGAILGANFGVAVMCFMQIAKNRTNKGAGNMEIRARP